MTTISLELAQELQQICKEKGITMPESFHAWRMDSNVYMSGKREYFLYQNFAYHHPELTPPEPEKVDGIKIIRAYTLDEILNILPEYIFPDNQYEFLVFKKAENCYKAYYEYHSQFNCYSDTNPANAACKLLIHLIKEGLI